MDQNELEIDWSRRATPPLVRLRGVDQQMVKRNNQEKWRGNGYEPCSTGKRLDSATGNCRTLAQR